MKKASKGGRDGKRRDDKKVGLVENPVGLEEDALRALLARYIATYMKLDSRRQV